MAPTSVAIVERAVRLWNEGELHGPIAARLSQLGERRLSLRDYRSVGEKVVACHGDRTLVFTIVRSEIITLAVFEPGQQLPDSLRA